MIDSHQHFWVVGQNGFEWPTPDLAAIHRDFGVADLRPLAADAGISGTIAVQSQPSDRDTDWLLGLAADEPLVRGVVAWADLGAADAVDRIADLAQRPKMRGVRPMLQAMAADDWVLRPDVARSLDAMAMLGLSFDALIRPRHIPVICRLAQRHPTLRIVIDHGAKPDMAGPSPEWIEGIAALARLPTISCKYSGLPAELKDGQPPEAMRPFARHLVDCFGTGRLMWGSDWPVVTLRMDYGYWLEMARSMIDGPEAGLDEVFGRTASAFYRL